MRARTRHATVRSRLSSYATALAALALALSLRWVIDPVLGDHVPLATLFGAVAFAVWIGGYRAAVLISLLGYLACDYLFIDPRGSLESTTQNAVGLAASLASCALIILLGESMRRARLRSREARDAARREARALETLTSHAPVGIFRTDESGECRFVNDRWCALAGLPREAALARGWVAPLHPDDRQRVEGEWRAAARAGRDYADELRFQRPDGEVSWLQASAVATRTDAGEVTGFIGTLTDITEAKRAEEARSGAERQLRLVADHAPVLIAYCDADARYVFVNRPYAERFGLEPEEVVGKRIPEVVGEEAYAAVRRHVDRVLAGEPVEFEVEIPYRVGGAQFMHCAYAPEHDAEGRVRGLVAAITNISERRRAEEALRELSRRKDVFLATLAHELRNPLAPIRSALELLRLADGDPAVRRGARETIERQLAHMVRLVDDLLDVGRITRDRLELRRARVALAGVVRTAVEAARPLADEAEQTLVVQLPETPLFLDVDPVRLTQVLTNLLNNASKYTGPRGHLRLTAEADGPDVLVAVEDDGAGIPAGEIERIFELFAQIDTPLERARSGLGIGLTLVKRLVELHGGRVVARSEGLGRGSRFEIRLPLADAPPEPPPEAAPPERTPARRILVVDDNRDAAETLAQVLRLSGHESLLAHDGPEAVARADQHRPDVVLLDLGLPGRSGYDVCRELRGRPWGADLFLVALTGWGQDEDRRRSREAGFDAHLVKPVDLDALRGLLAGLPLASR